MCKQIISSNLFKNKVTYKILAYKSYISVYGFVRSVMVIFVGNELGYSNSNPEHNANTFWKGINPIIISRSTGK